MIEFVAFAEQIRRIRAITYFSDPQSLTQQLSTCLLFKCKLKNVLKQLPSSIRDLNSQDNHEYAKTIKSDLLQYLTQHIAEDSIKVMVVQNQNSIEFPYQLVQKHQSDFEAIIRHIHQKYKIKLLSSQQNDHLSILLGKYDKNINCQTVGNQKNVFISCHAFLLLQVDNEVEVQDKSIKWIDLKNLMNYDSLRTIKTNNPDAIKQTLRHRSFVSDAAKRKAKNVEFACLLLNDKTLKGIFLHLWLYAVEVMIQGSHSKYHQTILNDYLKKAREFDINFRWYHPFGFLMKYNAKKNYQLQIDRFSYIPKEGGSVLPYLIGSGVLAAGIVTGVFVYKKWKSK